MRRVSETEAILQQITHATGLPSDRVEQVVSALRDAIDGLLLDGYTIFAPPFSLTYPNDPVAPVFAERIDNASEADVEAWNLGDMNATARWLDIPLAVYLRHPVASDLRVLIDLLDALEIEDADSPEGTEAVEIAEAWFDTFTEERRYRLSSVGLERDLEAWVIHHTERLVAIGYDVQLRRQQYVLPDRRRPDLVFDLAESDGTSGTLIVELKATGGYLEAVDQLVGYVDAFASLGLANGVLRGLLVADGFPPDVLAYADEKGIDTATLTELGYRRDLAAVTTKPSPRIRDTESETSMQTFIIYSHPLQAETLTPALYVDAIDARSVPADVRAYDPDDESLVQTAAAMKEQLNEPDAAAVLTVGHIAVSWGGITYADGSPVEPSDARPKHDDDLLFLRDCGPRAMQAAADFVRAAWDIRKDITYLSPRGLADWLQRTPEELRGDDDLPEHIIAAADALQGLPAAIMDSEVPDYYLGSAEDYIQDAERVLRSVTMRLEDITPLQALGPT